MTDKRASNPGEVTPEDAERLAERFRPAWELDDAVDHGTAAASPAEPSEAAPDAAVKGSGDAAWRGQPASPPHAASAPQPASPLHTAAEPHRASQRHAPAHDAAAAAATALTRSGPAERPPVVEPSPTAPVALVGSPTAARANTRHRQTMLGVAPPARASADPARAAELGVTPLARASADPPPAAELGVAPPARASVDPPPAAELGVTPPALTSVDPAPAAALGVAGPARASVDPAHAPEAHGASFAAPPILPLAPTQVTPPLPSVLLANDVQHAPSPGAAAARTALAAGASAVRAPMDSRLDDDDRRDAAAFRSGRKLPIAIGAAVILAVGIALAVSSSTPAPTVATAPDVPVPSAAVSAATRSTAPGTEGHDPSAVSPSAPHPPPVIATSNRPSGVAAREPIAKGATPPTDEPRTPRSRDAINNARTPTSPTVASGPKPVKKPAAGTTARPSAGGIVRDVPF